MSHYVEQVITDAIDAFKLESKTYTGQYTVLFDADNTLYKFNNYSQIQDSLSNCFNPGFYKNLPVFPEAPDVINALIRMGVKCGIISALINSPYCEPEKRKSFQYHFPMINEDMIYLVPFNESKVNLVQDIKHTILVDDYHVNINEWYNNGGVAIKKSYNSFKQRCLPTVHSLIELFPTLKELGVF